MKCPEAASRSIRRIAPPRLRRRAARSRWSTAPSPANARLATAVATSAIAKSGLRPCWPDASKPPVRAGKETTVQLKAEITQDGIRTVFGYRRNGHGRIRVSALVDGRETYTSIDKAAAAEPDTVIVWLGAPAHGGYAFFRRGAELDQCSGGFVRGHKTSPHELSENWSRSAWCYWFEE